MREGDTEPQSRGERKGVVFFSLAQCAGGEGREGINYKMVGPWHTQSLGGYFLDGEKSGCPWGSERLARGVSMAQLRVYYLKKFFEVVLRRPDFLQAVVRSIC